MVRKAVVKCDKVTMNVLESYPSCTDASIASGESPFSISNMCRKRTVGIKGYVWRFADSMDPDESFEGKRNRPVIIGDYKSGTLRVFSTISEAAKVLGTSPSNVAHAIRSRSKLNDRYRARYAR